MPIAYIFAIILGELIGIAVAAFVVAKGWIDIKVVK